MHVGEGGLFERR